MVDETVKKLLIKLGISTQDWKTAVNDIKSQLNAVNEQAKKDAAQMKATQKEQLDLTKQQIADQQRLTAEARTLAAVDQAKAQWQKQQQEAIKTATAQQVLQTAEAKKQAVIQQASVRATQDQVRLEQQKLRLMEQQRMIAERQAKTQQSGGMFGAIGKFASGISGGGLMGSIVGGAFLGTGFERAMELGVSKVHELVKALEEATGPAQQLRQVFDTLATQRGSDPSAMLAKLRESTRGLVNDTQLYTTANAFMRSGIKVSDDQMLKMISTTVNLGRATGRLPQALHALERSFISGRMQTLGYAVGIDRQSLALKGLPSTIDPVVRKTLEFNKVLEEEEKMLQRVGVPATTLPELFQQVSVAETNFIEGIAKGLTHTGSFSNAINDISEKLIQMGPRLEEIAEKVGKDLGEAFTFVTTHLHEIKTVAEALMGIAFVAKLGEWTLATKKLAEGLGLLKTAEESAALAGGAKTAIKGAIGVTGVEGAVGAESAALPAAGTLAVVVGGVLAAMGVYWVINYLRSHPEKTSGAGSAIRDYDYSGTISQIVPTIKNAFAGISHVVNRASEGLGQVAADTVGGFLYGKQSVAPSFGTNRLSLALPPGAGPLTSQQQLATTHTPGYKTPTEAGEDPNVALRNKLADQDKKLAEARAKITLEIFKQELADEQEAAKRSYDQGLSSLSDYTARQIALKKEALAATLGEIELERQAQQQELKTKGTVTIGGKPVNVTTKEEQDKASALIDDQAKQKRVSAISSVNKEIDAIQDKQTADTIAARRTLEDSLAKIAKEGVQNRLSALESEFKEGIVDANSYLSQRKELIQTELTLTLDGLEAKKKANLNNQEELAKINSAEVEAYSTAAKQRTQIDQQQYEIRLQYQMQQYQQLKRPIETQVQTARGAPVGDIGALTEQRQGTKQLQQLAVQQIVELNKQMNDPNLVAGSKTWNNIREQIAQATQELQKYNEEIRQMNNVPSKLGGIFGSLSQLASVIPGRGASAVSQTLGTMQESSQDIGKFTAAAANEGGPGANSGVELFKKLGSSFTDLFKSTGNAADKLKSFGDNLGGVISGIMGVVKGVNQVGNKNASGAGGALSGGMAGMQFGASFGPWGALAGGVAGGIMGGISGAKEKALQQDIHKITTQLQSIISDMQAGTISLSQAIQDLRQERQQAINILSQDPKSGKGGGKGGKKGYTPSQMQAVIEQIDSEISTLVNQQTQTLESLSTSLMEVSNPLQYQDYLQTLDQIIQKYQQFASAAQGNVQEMTAANQYLNDSLNQYVVTLSQNLNQAQQTAINDALTLINLEYQRQQIINQEAQSEYDVLTQGVLTRQRTTAMTKGQEIGQLRYERDMQLEQINEQISLQQYKVQTETQIFGLATTRIGLETQLLEAQESQAQYQIEQVQALAQVVAALTSGLTGGALMQQITSLMSTGAMPTESGIMYTLLTMLGLAGNVPSTATQGQYGITNWLAEVPATDASAAQYMASQDPNFPNMVMEGQYQQAAADAQQYSQQGEVEGYDMTGLISWLESMIGTAPGAAAGGDITAPVMVGENGPELLMPPVTGTVLSNPIVNALNGMMGGSTGTGSQRLQTESILSNLVQQRTGMEMTVISARQSQIQSEMQLLQAYQDTFANIAQDSSPTAGLEDMLQKVWENRGRYGGANFRRQNI
jgi:hypothetical protein